MTTTKKLRLNWYSVVAVAFAVAGLVVGVVSLYKADPFLGLFSISLVTAGGVAALVGLHD